MSPRRKPHGKRAERQSHEPGPVPASQPAPAPRHSMLRRDSLLVLVAAALSIPTAGMANRLWDAYQKPKLTVSVSIQGTRVTGFNRGDSTYADILLRDVIRRCTRLHLREGAKRNLFEFLPAAQEAQLRFIVRNSGRNPATD